EISKRPDVFSSAFEHGGVTIVDETEPSVLTGSASMITMNPPEHNGYRKLFAPHFSPSCIRRMENSIRAHVSDLFDRLNTKNTIDWIAAVGAGLPVRVVADLLGVPASMQQRFADWVNLIDGFDDPEFGGDSERFRAAMEEMRAFGLAIREDRMAFPR